MRFFRNKNYSTIKVRKRDIPDGLWLKCPSCNEIIFKQELEKNCKVCPKCEFHFQMNRNERRDLLIDAGTFEEWDSELYSVDTLKFTGVASYTSKLEDNIRKTGYRDAILSGMGLMEGCPVAMGIMDFSFLGASMGAVVGERVTATIERATERGLPVVMSCASGGARMYEGLFSLMQMAKTSAALARHAAAGLPYIALLTHPTMAGVMASFATLGDVIVAEPAALIGFAGPRVIKETTQQDLPEGFQRSEFLLEHGLIDRVIHRKVLKEELVRLLDYMGARPIAAGE